MATATKTTTKAKPSVKAPPKKKTATRSTRSAGAVKYDATGKPKLSVIQVTDIKYMGDEPRWEDQIEISEAERRIRMSMAFNWYNYSCDRKQARSFFESYASTQEELAHYPAKFKRLPDTAFGLTVGWVCRMVLGGFVLKDGEAASILQMIAKLEDTLLSESEEVSADAAPVVKKETIQDRLAEKFSETMGDIEGAIDEFITSGSDFSAYKLLQAQNIAVQFAVKIPELIQLKLDEMNEFLEGSDAQLLEGFKHITKRDAKARIKFYEAIINDAMAYKTSKIATRAKPKRKPVPPEKQVRGLKYLKDFAELGLKSIAATDILGATELWTYNTKTRKIGRFVVAMHGDVVVGQLGVKGSAIIGFDELKSVTKTLRKPAVTLAEFKTSGKPQLRKFMDTIKSVEVKLKGRISPETILLRAIK